METPSPLLQDARVVQALEIVEDLSLPHPSVSLLSEFITEALDPILASSYVLNRLSSRDTQDALSLVSDWLYIVESVTQNKALPTPPDAKAKQDISRRDGRRCCITGKYGSIFDPLCVVPILPIPFGWITEQKRTMDMLGAFFGAPYLDWWLSYIRDPGHITPYGNHWLVCRSAADASAKGFISLCRKQSSMIEFQVACTQLGPQDPIQVGGNSPLLGDHSRLGIPKADARIIGTHARLCRSVQYLHLARRIAPELFQDSSLPLKSSMLPSSFPVPRSIKRKGLAFSPLGPLTTLIGNGFIKLWLLMPGSIRLAAYRSLQKLGRRVYGFSGSSSVQRLPFVMYLRYRSEQDKSLNEFNALQSVRRHTTVPVPKPLDVVTERTEESQEDEADGYCPPSHLNTYLLTTRLPGYPLSKWHMLMSDRDYKRIISQMQDYLTQLRNLPTISTKGPSICNTLGGPCRDPRVRNEDAVGPFPDEPSRRGHKIVFTHTDLNPRNILVEQFVQQDGSLGWNVTGIIDWEFAGYFPEYWDYTKALYERFRWPRRYNDLVHEIFKAFGDYSAEYDVERRSWEMADGI
ncbi:kinase-like domain-containing protein [Xylariaceae sp. FL0594]|nr:kinase-like domain-containing protein [Xylariaceae sp. FL0594]